MTVLILVICFGVAVAFELWAIMHGRHVEDEEHEAGNRRVIMELRDIEAHRPDHIVS